MKQKRYFTSLTIAGSDSGGGAGIQADIKTFSSLGVYATSVITAITAQNTVGVDAVMAVTPSIVAGQLDAVFSDFEIDSVKIGMLYTPEIIRIVAEKLVQYKAINIVVDPVMTASSGESLIQVDIVDLYRKYLFPHITLFTPNIDEAKAFTGIDIDTKEDMVKAGHRLIEMGCKAVLMKGGHLISNIAQDFLLTESGEQVFCKSGKIQTSNNHGTGVTLSSAIAANLALGNSISESVMKSKE